MERHSRILEVENTSTTGQNMRGSPGTPRATCRSSWRRTCLLVEGVRAAYLVLKHASQKEGAARVSVVHNPSSDSDETGHYISRHCDSVDALKEAYFSKKTSTDGPVFRGPCEPGTTCTFANSRKANAPQNEGDLVVLARSEASYASKLAEAFDSEDRPRVLDAHRRS